jgi:hypothetical protein
MSLGHVHTAAQLIRQFNACKTPKAALKVVEERGLTAEQVAQYLYDAKDIVSVELLGECLGNRLDFWREISRKFPETFDCFAGMPMVKALRTYLWRLKLPGESILIERILEGFAAAYFKHNPEPIPQATDATPSAQGYYVKQPKNTNDRQPFCAHCGNLGKDDPVLRGLRVCKGCDTITFCRQCCKVAHKLGHAVGGTYGYGRACIAARTAAGTLGEDSPITFSEYRYGRSGTERAEYIRPQYRHWPKVSPFMSADAVMVLCYSVIMLTTNLHNRNIKAAEKMTKQQFLWQNRKIGQNFPGDYLGAIYDDIYDSEFKVLGMHG